MKLGILFLCTCVGILIGFNVRIGEVAQPSLPSFREQRELIQRERLEYRAAMLVPQGKRRCRMDWIEGCLVCKHRALGGNVKSTMC